MARFRRLSLEEARTLTRDQLLDRIEAEQAYWHRRRDRGQMTGADESAYRQFCTIMHAAIDLTAALASARSLVEDGHDDGYWSTSPTLADPSAPPDRDRPAVPGHR